ncbi:M48 family metallopeptidase [Uliginosibacterium gangwonense]|uniref:M48 metallopeptidase family protein n=1 Tax=Uliginosibacterium gangwonense TaxID=392736 RepID=UPI0003637BCD|nr:M48 family metallopeptidase [Uliginosibacterium gangwonense]
MAQGLEYLAGYPLSLQEQVQELIASKKLGPMLHKRYPHAHAVRNERALYDYVLEFKSQFLRGAAPISKVCYDNTIHIVRNALGTHTTISRVQGNRLKAKREIRVASLFRDMPEEFLRMIVVHELAHLKERDHDKAFYQLCCHMESDYHQLEFDLRAYLCWLDATGLALWA